MKKIYLLMALLLVLLKVNAQIDTTNLAGKYEYIFQQLDRNQIPTGFIDERAFPLFSLTPFNGLLTDSNRTFNDSKNNGGYGNNYGQASDDIFYKFSINATTQISISLCSSGFDTYMHLLDI